MRIAFIILITILCSSFGKAQDRFLTFVDGWMAKASIETIEGYETIGLGFASFELYDQDLRINKLNSDGQLTGGFSFEVDTVFGTSGRGQSSEMIELPDGNYLISGILIDTLNGLQHGALFEYSEEDETVTLVAAVNDSQTVQFWTLDNYSDSSIVCAGSWSNPGSGANSRVYHITLEGEVLWTQDIEWGNQFQKTRPTEVLTLADGNIAALFWEHDLDQPGFHDRWRARLSLLNSDGDILWTRYPGDHQNKKIRPGGIVEQDGEILVCYSDPYYYDDDGEWHPDTLNRVRFERYDTAGNVTAQDSLIEDPDGLLVLREPTQIMKCSDGNFLVAGYQTNRPSFLAKITPSYETIWYERYQVHDYDNDSLGTQEFKILNVIETSDGGFLCTGSYFTPPDLLYPSGFQSGFALKVDEYGCLEDGCQVGLDEYFIGDLEVWPNPSNGSVRIQVPENLRGSTLTIHDGLGRLVSTEIDLPSGILEYSISAPEGLYQVSLTAHRVLYQTKLILQ